MKQFFFVEDYRNQLLLLSLLFLTDLFYLKKERSYFALTKPFLLRLCLLVKRGLATKIKTDKIKLLFT